MGGGGLFQVFYDPVGAILGAISPALGTAHKWIMDITTGGMWTVNYLIATEIIEPIIKWLFGFEDEDYDVYEVAVKAYSMFDSQLYPSTQLDLVLRYAKDEDVDALMYARKFADTGEKQFGLYHRNGKWYYVDYLPEVRISGTTIDTNEVAKIIKEIYGYKNLIITDIYTEAPVNLDWCKWQLIQNYNYNYHANCLSYNGKYFAVKGIKYISENNNFKVEFTPITKALRKVYETTTFSTIKASDVDIKKYSIRKCTLEDLEVTSNNIDTISVKTVYEEIKIVDSVAEHIEIGPSATEGLETVYVTKYEFKQYYLNLNNMLFRHEEKETVYTPYEVTAGTVKPSLTQTVIHTEVVGHYLKYNTVVREYTKFLTINKKEISNSGKELVGASMDLVDAPIEEYTEQIQEVVTEMYNFAHVVNLERTVTTDADGVLLSEDDEILEENYTLSSSGNVEYEYKTLIEHIQISDNEIQREIKTKEIVDSAIDGSTVYDRIITTEYDKSYIVDVGTGKDYVISDQISQIDITMDNSETLELYVKHHQHHACYSVYYNANSERHLWIYDISSSLYPSLKNTTEHIMNIEAYPIIMLRNNYFDVRDYRYGSKNGKDRPNSVTEHRYKTSRDLLNKIGLNIEKLTDAYADNPDIDKIQDAFFAMAISPSNQSPIVSKVLYEFFDFISDKFPYISGQAGCSCTVKEPPFNGSFMWIPSATTLTEGAIGTVGTHTHSISGDTLTIRKQITPNMYKTITLLDCRCITIVNWDIADGGVDFDLDDEDLIIPLMVPVVERLSIIDKTQLLGNCSYLLFYCLEHQHVHLEWYETAYFASILQPFMVCYAIVITIVVTCVTWWFSGPAGGMTAAACMWGLMAALAVSVAVTLALKFIMENVQDKRLKMILAMATIAIAAAASYYMGPMTTASLISTMATAVAEMAATAVNIYVADYQQRLQREFEELQEQYNDFQRRYRDKAEELIERTKKLNSGLNASDMVGLIDMDSFDIERNASTDIALMSPTQFFYAAIDMYRNYDIMYSGYYDEMVHRFCESRLRIGIHQDS